MNEKLRTGRKLGRTIYVQHGAEPSEDDTLIGIMDTAPIAARIVDAINGLTAARCALPDCTKPATSVAFCSLEHSIEHTDFRRWLTERGEG